MCLSMCVCACASERARERESARARASDRKNVCACGCAHARVSGEEPRVREIDDKLAIERAAGKEGRGEEREEGGSKDREAEGGQWEGRGSRRENLFQGHNASRERSKSPQLALRPNDNVRHPGRLYCHSRSAAFEWCLQLSSVGCRLCGERRRWSSFPRHLHPHVCGPSTPWYLLPQRVVRGDRVPCAVRPWVP